MFVSAALVLLDDDKTLFGSSDLDALFGQVSGSAEWRTAWRQATFTLALKNTRNGEYHNFLYTVQLALDVLALERGSAIPADFQDRLNNGVGALPLHRDVKKGVIQLRQAGLGSECPP